MVKRIVATGVLLTALIRPAIPAPVGAVAIPALRFHTFIRTGLQLGAVLWDGRRFLYTVEGGHVIDTSDVSGHGLRAFVTVPGNGGEMRCIVSPGSGGFAPNAVYCHASDGGIYRINPASRSVALVARLPAPRATDGALTFDTGGRFGGALLAATGGSGSGPGAVYAVRPDGGVRLIGPYAGPGEAENIAVAPPDFGAAAGDALITIDDNNRSGRLLAVDPSGHVLTLVRGLADGLNPIVTIVPTHTSSAPGTSAGPSSGGPIPGLYLADWTSRDVFFAPAAQVRALGASVIVGTELGANLYAVQPRGAGYQASPIGTNLRARSYNLEGASYIDDR